MAREIERYLAEHPNAGDSSEGSRDWWFTRRRSGKRPAHDVVEAALDHLIADGVVTRRTLPNRQVIYSGVRKPN